MNRKAFCLLLLLIASYSGAGCLLCICVKRYLVFVFPSFFSFLFSFFFFSTHVLTRLHCKDFQGHINRLLFPAYMLTSSKATKKEKRKKRKNVYQKTPKSFRGLTMQPPTWTGRQTKKEKKRESMQIVYFLHY